MFSFISRNVQPGSRILEIGGGDSRILQYFKDEYQCWNLDKLEGVGNGPKTLADKEYKIVQDYIGNFNSDLPDNYFDLVFSISALEHVPLDDESVFKDILSDINRLLKPGGLSVHCIDHTTDLLLGTVDEVWTNPLIVYFFKNETVINKFIPLKETEEDPDLFVVSEKFYNEYWKPVTNVPYTEFGKPFSYNLLWKKNN
jgi:ubiquinone/menaquinone biosynthesis C-methylase UbiE